MIKGIGTDIIDIRRIARIYNKYNVNFINKILSLMEIEHLNSIQNIDKKICFIAKRFSAKEAVAKSIGTGISVNLRFSDITIYNDHFGKPLVKFSTNVQYDEHKIFISLSDEKKYVIAFAIYEH